MKRFPLYLIILILIFSSCACSSSDNASYSDDYEYLWSELESSYPYFAYLRDDKGIDVDGIRERYAEKAEIAESEEEFAVVIEDMFSELGNFAHLWLLTPELYRGMYNHMIYDENIAYDGNPFAEVLQDPSLSEIYEKPETPEEQIDEAEKMFPEVWSQYFSDSDVLYLRITSFDHSLIERDNITINDALSKYPDAKNLIIDIINNSGGSDKYWMQNLVDPFGGKYKFKFRNYIRKSDLTDRFYWDLEPSELPEDAPEWVERLGLDHCYEIDMTLPEEEKPAKDMNRWVLTNEGTYSAADKFVNFCRQTGWAMVVGTRTGGDGLGPTPVLIMLPDSGLLVRFSAIAGENSDGSMNAAGTAPDVICIKGEDPLDRCLVLIRED